MRYDSLSLACTSWFHKLTTNGWMPFPVRPELVEGPPVAWDRCHPAIQSTGVRNEVMVILSWSDIAACLSVWSERGR